MSESLKDVKSHFEFGQNWAEFSQLINEERIKEAEKSLLKFFNSPQLKGASFLDIGCGSGLFSLAALNLGADSVRAVDIDENSVKTTQALLTKFSPHSNWSCDQISVFDLDEEKEGQFDIVYSWGVLHHTGAMYEAIEKASHFVKKDGLFALALYRKTHLYEMWKKIKRFYKDAPRLVQKIISYIYIGAFCGRQITLRQNPIQYIQQYGKNRGMSFSHDVHDWLGGYPYESISPLEMREFSKKIGLDIEKEFVVPTSLGLFGSGCDEYVLRKK